MTTLTTGIRRLIFPLPDLILEHIRLPSRRSDLFLNFRLCRHGELWIVEQMIVVQRGFRNPDSGAIVGRYFVDVEVIKGMCVSY